MVKLHPCLRVHKRRKTSWRGLFFPLCAPALNLHLTPIPPYLPPSPSCVMRDASLRLPCALQNEVVRLLRGHGKEVTRLAAATAAGKTRSPPAEPPAPEPPVNIFGDDDTVRPGRGGTRRFSACAANPRCVLQATARTAHDTLGPPRRTCCRGLLVVLLTEEVLLLLPRPQDLYGVMPGTKAGSSSKCDFENDCMFVPYVPTLPQSPHYWNGQGWLRVAHARSFTSSALPNDWRLQALLLPTPYLSLNPP